MAYYPHLTVKKMEVSLSSGWGLRRQQEPCCWQAFGVWWDAGSYVRCEDSLGCGEGLDPDFRALGTHQAELGAMENQGRQPADMDICALDRLCLKQEVVRGEEGSAGLSPQSFLSVPHPIKRGEKRGMLSSLASLHFTS